MFKEKNEDSIKIYNVTILYLIDVGRYREEIIEEEKIHILSSYKASNQKCQYI